MNFMLNTRKWGLGSGSLRRKELEEHTSDHPRGWLSGDNAHFGLFHFLYLLQEADDFLYIIILVT